MTEKPISPTTPTPEELRAACQTLLGMPGPNPELAAKLRYVAELLADAGSLPAVPLLVWRETNQKVRHAVIQGRLVVGRTPGSAGLAFPEDRLLSREHFLLGITEEGCLLRNLKSKNGTAINKADQTVGERILRDGD